MSLYLLCTPCSDHTHDYTYINFDVVREDVLYRPTNYCNTCNRGRLLGIYVNITHDIISVGLNGGGGAAFPWGLNTGDFIFMKGWCVNV